MGYFGKIEEKEKALELRKKGLSYREILQTISVSKSTISQWCKDVEITNAQKKRLLLKKQFGQHKGSIVAADNKRRLRIERTNKIRKKAKETLGITSTRDRFIAGIALYAAEGTKRDGRGGFANADPLLIKFMMKWFIKFVKVPKDRVRGAIWLHEGLSEKVAKKYWSTYTGIPLSQFHKTYIAKDKRDSGKIRKNIHEYGVFSVTFTHAESHRKIMGWIYALFGDKIH